MGEVEFVAREGKMIVRSVFYFYGDASTEEIARIIARDIQFHWNEAEGTVNVRDRECRVVFEIEGYHEPELNPERVWYNDDPRLNFFRIENDVVGNISFVDGIGSNTGYLKLDNLLQTSTTAAHEYGHTLGLVHPAELDIRGGKPPSIMHPRGTICDPHFQYDPTAAAGGYGGCLNPIHRKVLQADIDLLRLNRLRFNSAGKAILGEFSSLYHAKHEHADFA